MKDTPWQIRARDAGLTQKLIAELTQRNQNSVGRALSGGRMGADAAGPYIAVVMAWEIMTLEQRAEWVRRIRSQEATASAETLRSS